MDKYTVAEVSYKNGYKKGFQDGVKKLADKVNNLTDFWSEIDNEYYFKTEDVYNLLEELTEKKGR